MRHFSLWIIRCRTKSRQRYAFSSEKQDFRLNHPRPMRPNQWKRLEFAYSAKKHFAKLANWNLKLSFPPDKTLPSIKQTPSVG